MAFANPFGLNNSDSRAGTEEMARKHFRRVHKTVKATISFAPSVHVSDHLSVMEHLGPTGHIFTYLRIFLKFVNEFKCD